MMLNAAPIVPKPQNSPFVSFAKGTTEREKLGAAISFLRGTTSCFSSEVPLWIEGPVYTNKTRVCLVPHDLNRRLGIYNAAEEGHVHDAIRTVLTAKEKWSRLHWFLRLSIFQRAASLLEKKYLIPMVAAVMEDYSKTPYEAFIDVQELIDFWRFNSYYAYTIYQEQPDSNTDTQNMLEYRPLEGFVFAVSPNNFVAINGNLCTAPLMMGNTVIAKPSSDVVYSFNLVLQILLEAGLPHDVLAVLYGDSKMIGDIVLDNEMLSGVHFTGGTETFKEIRWRIAQNEYQDKYRNFVRIVGETGGKDFIVVYDDHDPVQTASAIVVGGFGAQGRKCSATSRVYMTEVMWAKVKPHLERFMQMIKVGDVADFRNYMGAIINKREYFKIVDYINVANMHLSDKAYENLGVKEILGGYSSSDNGYFIRPMVIVTKNPNYPTMKEEIFGPVVTVCLLPKEKFENGEVLKICDRTSPFALTGAVQTNDIYQFSEGLEELRYAAGNVYNWKTTGAMVNAQPFSGARMSGTNSKVGWRLNLYNWIDARTISLTHVKPEDFAPPYLDRA